MIDDPDDTRVRLDKWLWAARFFKTRSLAAEAVSGGHVHLNGTRAKPSRPLKPGDELRIRKGEQEFVVLVKGLSERRGPAKAATLLYDETEASRRAREAQAEARRLTQASTAAPLQRPDKRGRRQIRRFTGRD